MSDRARRNRAAQRRARRIRRLLSAGVAVLVVAVVVVVALAVRGGDDGPSLSAEAQAGRQAAVRNSCVGCHGRSGEGGANRSGPTWIGLSGSTVELADGTTVVADRDYLVESIVDPHAKQVAGYAQKMPADPVAPADVMAIVQYIEELAEPSPSTP